MVKENRKKADVTDERHMSMPASNYLRSMHNLYQIPAHHHKLTVTLAMLDETTDVHTGVI